MKQKLFMLVMALVMMAMSSTMAWAISGSGTSEDHYKIGSSSDWWNAQFMVKLGNSTSSSPVYIDITGDFSVGAVMLRDKDVYIVLDGQGHNISLNSITTSDENTGLFGKIGGGEVKNLRIGGALTTSKKYMGNLCGKVTGALTITNVLCSASLAYNNDEVGDATAGGFIGQINGNVTFNQCGFTYRLYCNSKGKNMCGMVGYRSSGTVVFNNCFCKAEWRSDVSSDNYAYMRNDGSSTTYNNCYYVSYGTGGKVSDKSSGKPIYIADSKFGTGELAYMLNGSSNGVERWYQNLDNGSADGYPWPYSTTASSHGKVWYGTFHGTTKYSNCSHTMTHHDAVKETCTTNGNIEYWTCNCDASKYYTNAAGTQTTTTYVIKAPGHAFDETNDPSHTVCTRSGCNHTWLYYTATERVSRGFFHESGLLNAKGENIYVNEQHTFSDGKGVMEFSSKLTTITNSAFTRNSQLTSITIPHSVTKIDKSAFGYCTGLASLTIPNSVTSIGYGTFEGCTGIKGSLTIPTSVKSIGAAAFLNCSGFTGTLTIPTSITSIGDDAFSGCSGFTGTLKIPNSITSIGGQVFGDCSGFTALEIPTSVTSIGQGAFSGCSGFKGTLSIPSSVTSIGEFAFMDCSGFTGTLTIPDKVTSIGQQVFYGCSGFTALSIPTSVTSIGFYAFRGCSGFKGTLSIPSSVTSIGYGAFQDCSGFTALAIPTSVTSIGDYAFQGCSGFKGKLTIPSSIKSIGEGIFMECSGFTALSIPTSVTSIGVKAFYHCSGFTGTLTIPNSVTSIGKDAFDSCSGFTGTLTIPNSITSIGSCVFNGCSGFTGTLKIPNSVTSIGNSAFAHCTGITALSIPTSVTSIEERAFYYCSGLKGTLTIPNSVKSLKSHVFQGCSGITALEIPNSVTSIGEFAFYGCSGITALEIPNSVTSIGIEAFYGCSGIKGTLTIPSSVTSIGTYAFANCSGLTALEIPPSLTSIPDGAFYDCWGIGALTIPNSITKIGTSAFGQCTGFTSLSIPESVQRIGDYAFASCKSIKDIELKSIPYVLDATFDDCKQLSTCTLTLGDGSYVYTGGSYRYLPALTAAPTYTRSIAATSNWGTVVLPFEAKSDAQVQLYELTAVANGAMTFSPVATVAANTPCVFRKKVANATSVTFTANSTAISPDDPKTPAAVDGLAIRGTYKIKENQTGMYFIAQDQFWYAESPITISPFRAWFEGTLPSQASLRIEEADNAEDLQLIEREDGTLHMVNGKCHDLMGRQIGEGRTGLQIRDGRVIMVK